ncbi:hypothetical protein BJL95_04585 [Methylomonas sp. LWB]|uniref:hypothetical protein n=1 Tax=Methylomonas sp. LWB TaxID=1905845 RepID=UPI0008DA8AC1|nr:hypothetical protein [Methylomonas sp. LWB]OHX37853.1 hypothetical protein BJL95_04585 [Methylomonas sp. LWB]
MRNLNLAVLVLFATATFTAQATPPASRTLSLEDISLERIEIQGQIQTWKLNKVCIDQQAYLLLLRGLTEPVGISPSFKNGKPEQCRQTLNDSPIDE